MNKLVNFLVIILLLSAVVSCKNKNANVAVDHDSGHIEFTYPVTVPVLNDTDWHELYTRNLYTLIDSFMVASYPFIDKKAVLDMKWANFYIANTNQNFQNLKDIKVEITATGKDTIVILENLNIPNNIQDTLPLADFGINFCEYSLIPDMTLHFFLKAKQPITTPVDAFLYGNVNVCEYLDCTDHN